MKLLFKNSMGKKIMIANVENEREAMKEINRFCAERDFTIPYYRCWGSLDEDGISVDVGSHTEFFLIVNE